MVHVVIFYVAGAVIQDLRKRKISNRYILAGYIANIMTLCYLTGINGMLHAILFSIVMILLLYPLYLIKAIGAGDIKLFGVMACLLNVTQMIKILFLSFLLAAFIGVFLLLRKSKPGYSHIAFTVPVFLATLFIGGS